MGVLVCYDDYTYDVINDYHLDYLLDKGCIIGYDNSGNWVKLEDAHDAPILLTELAQPSDIESPADDLAHDAILLTEVAATMPAAKIRPS